MSFWINVLDVLEAMDHTGEYLANHFSWIIYSIFSIICLIYRLFYIQGSIARTNNTGMYCWRNVLAIVSSAAHTEKSLAIFFLDEPILSYILYIVLFYIQKFTARTINTSNFYWSILSAIMAATTHTEESLAIYFLY